MPFLFNLEAGWDEGMDEHWESEEKDIVNISSNRPSMAIDKPPESLSKPSPIPAMPKYRILRWGKGWDEWGTA